MRKLTYTTCSVCGGPASARPLLVAQWETFVHRDPRVCRDNLEAGFAALADRENAIAKREAQPPAGGNQ